MGSYRHLTRDDREQVAAMRAAGLTLGEIGGAIGKSTSTISRELRRNALDSGRYSAQAADGSYMARRQRPARLELDAPLGLFVRQRLSEGWSPQQISGWLKRGAEPSLGAVAMETIYAFIYRAEQKAEELWRYLARRRKKRRPLRSRPARDIIKDRVSIHDRPDEIATRSKAGHWEGDLIICKRSRPVLVLHERKTRVTLAARLTGKGAAETASAIMAIFKLQTP